jgi:hypothetical protein
MTKFFSAPSPKGTNHAGLFLDQGGRLFDRNGNLWGRSSMAYDELPPTPKNGVEGGPRLSERQPNISGDDEKHEHVRDFLKNVGLSPEQIEHVFSLIHGLPNPVKPGRDQAMDAALPRRGRDLDSFARDFPEIARIGTSEYR